MRHSIMTVGTWIFSSVNVSKVLGAGARLAARMRARIAARHRAGVAVAVAAVVGSAMAQSTGVTGPMIDAIQNAGDGILEPVGVLLGILTTVAIGWAILRTIRGS